MFASLHVPNYRRYFSGALVSNIGTWVSRTAQDWLVLRVLTDSSATALGVVTTMQFIWIPVLSAITGTTADRFSKRRILLVTQSVMLLTSALLAGLTLSGHVRLWHVYALASVQGITMAFDGPARMTFVSEVVPPRLVMNAISLNSASFNGGRLIGPAVGGLLIAAFSPGIGLLVNTVSFVAVLAALLLLDPSELSPAPPRTGRGGVREGIVYLRGRPDLLLVMAVVVALSLFAMNFSVYNALMATAEFGKGAAEFGLLGSVMAVGSLGGSLLSARRTVPRLRDLLVAGAGMSLCLVAMALAPSYLLYAAVLAPAGFCALTGMTTANSTVQLGTDPAMRGRVMALYMALNQGSLPLGALVVGFIADHLGVRYALGIGAVVTACAFGAASLVNRRHGRSPVRQP